MAEGTGNSGTTDKRAAEAGNGNQSGGGNDAFDTISIKNGVGYERWFDLQDSCGWHIGYYFKSDFKVQWKGRTGFYGKSCRSDIGFNVDYSKYI